jgi:mycobactin polyketide synthetase MbtD
VLSPPCDITDPDALAAVAAEFDGGAASLLIHAAGSATFARAGELTTSACADTFAAKLTGLELMVQHWPLRADARILLCSSVSGVWGGLGHGAYSAANRMLDVMADQLRTAGRRCVAVRWGLWQGPDNGTGIVDAAEIANIERSGLRAMAPAQAIAASLGDHCSDPLVLSADIDRLRIFLAGPQPTPAMAPIDTTQATAAQTVQTELASVLSVADAGTLDLDSALFDLGVDSLLAIDLRKRLRRVTGRNVPLAMLLGGITGTELVDELEREEPEKADQS